MTKRRRLPFANVAPLVADLSLEALSAAAGADLSTVRGWRRPDRPDATIREDHADHLALYLEVGLAAIWPDYYADLERLCDWQACSAVFVPWRKDQRFCSADCRYRWRDHNRSKDPDERARRAEHARQRYATDPEFAEAKRRSSSAYSRANRRARRIKERARYHARKTTNREDIPA